ncbi:MAG: hypothetical protein R3240_04610, partial [Gammaproteobacteria bacterium]|nr:hypothetical protein [Gammaproteobacteria bacterium]
ATDKISVKEGATLEAKGVVNQVVDAINLKGDGAYIRVSNAQQAALVRENSKGEHGSLVVENTALLKADNTIIIDASQKTIFDGDLSLDDGALNIGATFVQLGSTTSENETALLLDNDFFNNLSLKELTLTSREGIDLMGDINIQTDKLVLDTPYLNAIDAADVITANFSNNVFAIRNSHAASGFSSQLNVAGKNKLNINAQQVNFGNGDYRIYGFDTVNIKANDPAQLSEVKASGSAHAIVDGNLSLLSDYMTAASGSELILDVAGDFSSQALTDMLPDNMLSFDSLGGFISINAGNVSIDNTIVANSGRITLHSQNVFFDRNNISTAFPDSGFETFYDNKKAGDIRIGANAVLDVSGVNRYFADRQLASYGGEINLLSDNGSILLEASDDHTTQAVINLSAGSAGNNAGSLNIIAPRGELTFNAAVSAASNDPAYRNASFNLDVSRFSLDTDQEKIAPFNELNTSLNQSGFTYARYFRLRNQEVELSADTEINAHSVSIQTDQGGIDIHGRINASGERAGSITLQAKNNLVIQPTAELTTKATGENQQGGDIFLSSNNGLLDIKTGDNGDKAKFDVSGTLWLPKKDSAGNFLLHPLKNADGTPVIEELLDGFGVPLVVDGVVQTVTPQDFVYTQNTGSIRLRAKGIADINDINASGEVNDVAILLGDADYVGVDNLIIEAYQRHDYETLQIDTQLISEFQQQTSAFIDSLSRQVKERLGDNILLRPGLELFSQHDIELNSNWDFNLSDKQTGELLWRYEGQPGYLRLSAVGDIKLNAGLSDGFADETLEGTYYGVPVVRNYLQQGESWSLSLQAGNAQLTDTSDKGNINLSDNVLIRTGTGDIHLLAERDIKLNGSNSAIYTAGEASNSYALLSARNAFTPAVSRWGTLTFLMQDLFFPDGEYPLYGGDITINAGGAISQTNASQAIVDWLHRSDPEQFGVSWAVAPNRFTSGIASLGGGNVSIQSGGDLQNLSAYLPSTAKILEYSKDNKQLVHSLSGGGNLDLVVNGDIYGSRFLLGRGEADIQVAGKLAAYEGGAEKQFTSFYLMDGKYNLWSGNGLEIGSVVSPTMLEQSFDSPLRSNFFTYSPDAAFNASVLSGELYLNNEASHISGLRTGDKTSATVLGTYSPIVSL